MATSSWLNIFRQVEGIPASEFLLPNGTVDVPGLHTVFGAYFKKRVRAGFNWTDFNETRAKHDMFTFTMVRHPLER